MKRREWKLAEMNSFRKKIEAYETDRNQFNQKS